jgi:hypothetical protein
LKAFSLSPRDEAANTVFAKCNAKQRRSKMLNWPEMLHHAEDWAAGFWAGAGAVSLMMIVGAGIVLLIRGI